MLFCSLQNINHDELIFQTLSPGLTLYQKLEPNRKKNGFKISIDTTQPMSTNIEVQARLSKVQQVLNHVVEVKNWKKIMA